MTEEKTAPEVPAVPVTLHGREIYTRMPSPEQILVWQRILRQLQGLDSGSWTGEEVMAALEKARRIIDSVIVNKADVSWLDDGFLDGTITFQDLMPFIGMVAEAFSAAQQEHTNRVQKRATAKKATRKRVDQ